MRKSDSLIRKYPLLGLKETVYRNISVLLKYTNEENPLTIFYWRFMKKINIEICIGDGIV